MVRWGDPAVRPRYIALSLRLTPSPDRAPPRAPGTQELANLTSKLDELTSATRRGSESPLSLPGSGTGNPPGEDPSSSGNTGNTGKTGSAGSELGQARALGIAACDEQLWRVQRLLFTSLEVRPF